MYGEKMCDTCVIHNKYDILHKGGTVSILLRSTFPVSLKAHSAHEVYGDKLADMGVNCTTWNLKG